jgi:predicted O-methyltransferase YrrM
VTDGVANQLMELAGGDPFADVRRQSEEHQRAHGCGLHHAGGPQMQLVAALARAANATRALDLGCGLGYSTLWIASATGDDGSVVGIDDDPGHTGQATSLAAEAGFGSRVSYVTGRVGDVLPTLDGPFWITTPPIGFVTVRPASLP